MNLFKHIVSIVAAAGLCAVSFMSALPTTNAETQTNLVDSGDVNGDGIVNAQDATMILIAAAKIGTGSETGLTAEQEIAADVNGNDIINANDATVILQYAAAVGTGYSGSLTDYLTDTQQPATEPVTAEPLATEPPTTEPPTTEPPATTERQRPTLDPSGQADPWSGAHFEQGGNH